MSDGVVESCPTKVGLAELANMRCLAVNAANTLVDFLLESYTLRQRKDAKDLATKVTDHLSV